MCQLNFKFVSDACWLKQIRNAKSGGVALNWQWSQALISLAWSKISSRLSWILTVITVIRRAARSWGRVFTNLWQQTYPSAFNGLVSREKLQDTLQHFMEESMVSCRFALKPIHRSIPNNDTASCQHQPRSPESEEKHTVLLDRTGHAHGKLV